MKEYYGNDKEKYQKITEIGLEILSDYYTILMIKGGLKRGVSLIYQLFQTAMLEQIINIMDEKYDKIQESTHIPYLDKTNLYGWAMSHELPTHGSECTNKSEFDNWKDYTCILEIDL